MATTGDTTSTKLLLLTFHVTAFLINFCGEGYSLRYVHIPEVVNTYAGRFKFLTFIDTIIQTLYFGFCIINDVFGSNVHPSRPAKSRTSLQKLRDFLAAAIAFPVGTFVVVTFWGLYAIDRSLVFPKHLDEVIPMWLNHIMHTTVLLFLLIEKFLVYHHYPSAKKGLPVLLGFALFYQLWVLWIAFYADIWVYPVLKVLSWPGKIGFFAACWAIMTVFYFLGEAVTKFFWGGKKPQVLKKTN